MLEGDEMKKSLLAVAVLGAMAMLPAQAAIVGFANEFSGGVQCANAVTGCGTLETTAIAGGVHYNLTGTMTSTEFITGLYGNIDPFATPTVSGLSGSGLDAVNGFQFSENGFKADGDGYFDWFLDLSSNPPRFDGTDTLSWDFLGITLAQTSGISQGGSPGKDGFQYAIHAQGLVNGGSGWDSNTPCCDTPPPPPPPPPNNVPEPGSLALVGSALVAAHLALRRKAKKDAEKAAA
jgi:hypothetical protein